MLLLFNHPLSLSKRYTTNPSQVKTFSIDSIMEHNQETSLEPINTSSTQFGVDYESHFVVLDDGKHIIGVDPINGENLNKGKHLILENVQNGKADEFQASSSLGDFISTLVYDEKTGSLYTGDTNGNL